MRKTMELGKVDYNGSGRKNCMATLEWELTDTGNFSMSADIWNPRHTDIYCGGQCVDEVVAYFPNNAKVQRMAEIWRLYHLNDMKAGCIHQRLAGWDKVRIPFDELPNSHANRDKDGIMAIWIYKTEHPKGLLAEPCPECGYKYGTSWLKEAIPQDIQDEIRSW